MDKDIRTNRRRELLSSPKVQLKVIGIFGFMALMYAVTNCYISIGMLNALTEGLMSLRLTPENRYDISVLLAQRGQTLTIQLIIFTVVALVTLLMGGVFLSHVIAGPIFHLRKYLQGVARGETPVRAVRFRKNDFFHDLAESFNEFQRARGVLPPAASGGSKNPAPSETRPAP